MICKINSLILHKRNFELYPVNEITKKLLYHAFLFTTFPNFGVFNLQQVLLCIVIIIYTKEEERVRNRMKI